MRGVVLCGLVLTLVGSISAQCINDCSDHGDCNNGQCTCQEGWTGVDCAVYDCAAHADGCSGHGQCRGTSCVCHAGYGDHNCAAVTTNCPDHCKGHGSCLNGLCSCDNGFTGTDCGVVDPAYSCPQNCSGHGFCDVSGDAPTCYCMPSFWSGEACDIEQSLCPPELNNCTGHGICGPTNPLVDVSPWTCACEPGFTGDSCNQVSGLCPNNCMGHGLCVGDKCVCDTGFGGDDCGNVVAVPSCVNNCSGHGRCEELSTGVHGCVCQEGYTGDSCVLEVSLRLCPGNCSGKGECLASGQCACNSGFRGTACEIALPQCVSNCSANGVCTDGVCVCEPGFSGDDCSQACHTGGGEVGCHADRNHGVCVQGECLCRDGEWEGVGCEIPAHDSTLGAVVSSNNPVGIIVLSILAAAVLLLVAGYVFNYTTRGKRGLNAVPGVDAIRSSMKGDDYDDAPENRYASNY